MKVLEQLNNTWSKTSKRIILSPSLFAKSSLFYAQELGDFVTFNNYFVKRANLDSYLILLTLDGSGELVFNNQKSIIRKNDLFFIDCKKLHKYTCIDKNWAFLWIHINGVTLDAYYNQFVQNNPNNIISLHDPKIVQDILRQLININTTPSVINELISSKLINDLLTEILLHNFKSYTQSQQFPDFLTKVINDIDKNFADALKLEDLANKYNINMFHLSREFKRYLGINFKTYLTIRRLNTAKSTLMYSNDPISKIAIDVGFDSTSHFIEIFKKYENTTPLAYRSLWHNI